MSVIAIIPARGGSKRIPRKNIKLFCGKPIIAYSIEAALKSACFDRVIVSTDDEEIAMIAREYGAEVPFFRSKELSDDYTSVTDVVIDVIHKVEEKFHENVSHACLIYATAPMIDVELMSKAYKELLNSDKSFAIGITSYPSPIQRALILENSGIKQLFNKRDSRSQDLVECYHDAAHFCWGTKQAFLEKHDFFSDQALPIIIPRVLVQDIDTLEDWEVAESLFKAFC